LNIISGTGDVLLAPDWHRAETAGPEAFRWLTADAIAYVPAVERIEHRVSIELDAAHALDGALSALSIFDDEGRLLAEADVGARQTIQFHLPAGPPKLHAVRFSPRDTARFRVFDIRAEPLRVDVVPLLGGFRIGRGGWYSLEEGGHDVFRWVNNDAEIVVTNADAAILELEAAPGPSLGSAPLTLEVLGRSEKLARFVVGSRQRIEIRLPDAREAPYAITLHVEHGGAALPGNPRILNFRLFHIPAA
jgi:hypothetical protein